MSFFVDTNSTVDMLRSTNVTETYTPRLAEYMTNCSLLYVSTDQTCLTVTPRSSCLNANCCHRCQASARLYKRLRMQWFSYHDNTKLVWLLSACVVIYRLWSSAVTGAPFASTRWKAVIISGFQDPKAGNESPMATNVVIVLGVVVIRFSITWNFFISQPIVINLNLQICNNILHSRIPCRIFNLSLN